METADIKYNFSLHWLWHDFNTQPQLKPKVFHFHFHFVWSILDPGCPYITLGGKHPSWCPAPGSWAGAETPPHLCYCLLYWLLPPSWCHIVIKKISSGLHHFKLFQYSVSGHLNKESFTWAEYIPLFTISWPSSHFLNFNISLFWLYFQKLLSWHSYDKKKIYIGTPDLGGI